MAALLAVLVAAAIGAGAVALLGRSGSPSGADHATQLEGGLPAVPQVGPGDRQAVNYFTRTEVSFLRHHRGCLPHRRLTQTPHLQPLDYGSPSRLMLLRFGVLRRPAASGTSAAASTARQWGRPFVRYARVAQRRYGSSFVVVPVTDLVEGPPVPCVASERAALPAALERAPAKIRLRVQEIAVQILRDEAYIRRHSQGLCVIGGGDASCGSFLFTLARGALQGSSSDGSPTLDAYLVPDGVANVSVRYSSNPPGTPASRATRRLTLTVPVVNNLAVWQLANQPPGIWPAAFVWHAADKRVIRTVTTGF